MKSAKERLAQSDGVAVQPVRSAKERLAQSPSMRVPSDTSAMPATSTGVSQPPVSAYRDLENRAPTIGQRKPEGFMESLQSVGGGAISGLFDIRQEDRPQSVLGKWAQEFEGAPGHTAGEIIGTVAPYGAAAKVVGAIPKLQKLPGMVGAGLRLAEGAVRSGGVGLLGSGIQQGAREASGEDAWDVDRMVEEGLLFGGLHAGLGTLGGLGRMGKKAYNKAKPLNIKHNIIPGSAKVVEGVKPSIQKPPPTPIPTRKKYMTPALKSLQESGVLDLEYVPKTIRGSASYKSISEAVRKRSVKLTQQQHSSEQWIQRHKKKVTDQESEDMIYAMSGTRNPNIDPKVGGVQGAEGPLGRLSENPQAKIIMNRIRGRFDKVRRYINNSGADEQVKHLDDFMPGFWKTAPKTKTKVVSGISTYLPASKSKAFANIAEGVELGAVPKYNNVFDYLREYEKIAYKVTENQLLVKKIKGLADEFGKELITLYPGKAGKDWVKVNSQALVRAIEKPIISRKLYSADKDLLGGPFSITRKAGNDVYVHPEIARPLRAVFSQPWSNKAINVIETTNAITKKAMLTASFFHHMALTESALYSGVNPFKAYKGWKKLRSDPRFRKELLGSGVDVGAPSDVQISKVNKFLDGIVSKSEGIPVLHQGAKSVRYLNRVNDKFLWDFYHPGLKAHAYEAQKLRMLKKFPNATAEDITKIKRGVGEHVNSAFGGQNWEQQLRSAKWRQAAHWAMLAPDWTISNAKIATAALKMGKNGLKQKVEGKLARAYWRRAAITYMTMYNAANYASSGHFLWDNPEGHKLDIDLGNGQFLKVSKQAREPIAWAVNGLKEFGVKTSPVFQLGFEQLSGVSPSGYPAGFDARAPLSESAVDRVQSIIGKGVPFSMKSNNKFLTFPVVGKDTTKTNNARGSRRGSTTKRGQQGR